MPYRQIWNDGHAHATELRRQAALERARRAISGEPHALDRALAAIVRRAAVGLARFADRLEARTSRSRHASRGVSTRAGGA